MAFQDQKKYFGIVLILTPLVIAFAFAWYKSAKHPMKPYHRFKNKFRNVLNEAPPPLPSDISTQVVAFKRFHTR